MATLTSRFRAAAGLKKTGEVGGGSCSMLAGGTRRRVDPSRYSTNLIPLCPRSQELLNESTIESGGTFMYFSLRREPV
jgi:hypothetical protein